MTVYIEYVIIDNFIIDFLLIKSSFKIAKIKSNLLRQIISASVGTAFAVIVPFFNLNGVFNVIVKVLAGGFIVFTGGKYVSFKSYFTALFFFFLFTFISGGLIIALFNLADIAITLGTFLLVIGYIIENRTGEKNERTTKR